MPKKFKQTQPLVDQLSADERAQIIEADIREALEDGRFEFVHGYLRRVRKPDAPTCTYGGCAIAALALACGSRPEGFSLSGWRCREEAVETGLVTDQEVRDLEDAYEGFTSGPGPFAALGRRLRLLAEARGGRYRLDVLVQDVEKGLYYTVSRDPVRP